MKSTKNQNIIIVIFIIFHHFNSCNNAFANLVADCNIVFLYPYESISCENYSVKKYLFFTLGEGVIVKMSVPQDFDPKSNDFQSKNRYIQIFSKLCNTLIIKNSLQLIEPAIYHFPNRDYLSGRSTGIGNKESTETPQQKKIFR